MVEESPSPYPKELLELSEKVSKVPGVESSGLTMTPEREWAILVFVTAADGQARAQLEAQLRRLCGNTPIVPMDAQGEMLARPFYPDDKE